MSRSYSLCAWFIAFLILRASLVDIPFIFASQWTPALTEVIQGAKKEGQLKLTWGASTLGGADGAKKAQQLLNKIFGLDIEVIFSPGPSMARVGNQIAMEHTSGQSASSDVYLASAPQIAPLLKRDLFQTVHWGKLFPSRITPKMVEGNGTVIKFGSGLSGATYNAQLLPHDKPPQKLTDFLRPEWKGKIASTPYAASFDVLAAKELWGPDQTLAYVRDLSKQISGLMRCGEEERIAAREFAALVLDCTGQNALMWQERGAPLEQIIPSDAPQIRYRHLTVPKNAAHPNAAKLFTVLMLTKAGQELAWKTWKIDLHFFPESNMHSRIERLQKQGIKFAEITTDFWLKYPELGEVRKQMVKMLREAKN